MNVTYFIPPYSKKEEILLHGDIIFNNEGHACEIMFACANSYGRFSRTFISSTVIL